MIGINDVVLGLAIGLAVVALVVNGWVAVRAGLGVRRYWRRR